jgi:hypothetical protein
LGNFGKIILPINKKQVSFAGKFGFYKYSPRRTQENWRIKFNRVRSRLENFVLTVRLFQLYRLLSHQSLAL